MNKLIRIPKMLENYTHVKSIRRETVVADHVKKQLQQLVTLATIDPHSDKIIHELQKLGIAVRRQSASIHIDWQQLISLYLQRSSAADITAEEADAREFFFRSTLPALLKAIDVSITSDISFIDLAGMLEIQKLLSRFPKRNIHRYRVMTDEEIVKQLHSVKTDERLSPQTVSKLLKRINSLIIFAQGMGVETRYKPHTLQISEGKQRTQRDAFTTKQADDLCRAFEGHRAEQIIIALRYSGLRLSELWKATIHQVEGVWCFDLTHVDQKLKTLSSYRIVPVHHSVDADILIYSLKQMTSKYITKLVARHLDKVYGKQRKLALYSLRHTFATELISLGVNLDIVSELMGHAHKSMTMNRYVKGYPVKILKEVIETL